MKRLLVIMVLVATLSPPGDVPVVPAGQAWFSPPAGPLLWQPISIIAETPEAEESTDLLALTHSEQFAEYEEVVESSMTSIDELVGIQTSVEGELATANLDPVVEDNDINLMVDLGQPETTLSEVLENTSEATGVIFSALRAVVVLAEFRAGWFFLDLLVLLAGAITLQIVSFIVVIGWWVIKTIVTTIFPLLRLVPVVGRIFRAFT